MGIGPGVLPEERVERLDERARDGEGEARVLVRVPRDALPAGVVGAREPEPVDLPHDPGSTRCYNGPR